MADSADPANRADDERQSVVRPSDFTTEHLIEFFDEVAGKLVALGYGRSGLSMP